MFDARSLVLPVLGAPMAGGPSTPELVAAVNSAGGIGFLAAGYCSAAQVAEQIAQGRALSTGPVGVNLFVMAEEPVDMASVGVYIERRWPSKLSGWVWSLAYRSGTTTA